VINKEERIREEQLNNYLLSVKDAFTNSKIEKGTILNNEKQCNLMEV